MVAALVVVVAAVKAMKKCCDLQERLTLVFRDASERLDNDLVGPLTTFVDGQASGVKDACRKVDKTQEKRRHASTAITSATATQTLTRASANKADMKAMELIVRFNNAASIECVKTFITLFKSSSFAFIHHHNKHHNHDKEQASPNHPTPTQSVLYCGQRGCGRDGGVQRADAADPARAERG